MPNLYLGCINVSSRHNCDILKGVEEHSAGAIAELIRKDGQFMRRFEIVIQREFRDFQEIIYRIIPTYYERVLSAFDVCLPNELPFK